MRPLIGIRREDKNRWERRAPLTPGCVRRLVAGGIDVAIQPSGVRAFRDDEYAAAGARGAEDLSDCRVVFGVKEMPPAIFRPGVAYAFFAHVAKGQAYNMPMLRALLDAGAHLIDYEKIVDAAGRRLIFFGRYAGLAGAVDTLWALGRRLLSDGAATPLAGIEPAHRYDALPAAVEAVVRAGREIAATGLPERLAPLVIGVAGYGNVAGGVIEILDALGARDVPPEDLPALFEPGRADTRAVYRVTFREEHTVEPIDHAGGQLGRDGLAPPGPPRDLAAKPLDPFHPGAAFDLAEFFRSPERYRGRFERFVPMLTVLFNCIYWAPRYPRLVTKAFLREHFGGARAPRLRVIGDISCDVLGGVECNVGTTTPDSPVYVWDPVADRAVDGWEGRGPVVLAIDNLPCEIPVESSTEFGNALMRFVPDMARADWTGGFGTLDLPREVKDAVIAYAGRLTPAYEYISEHLRLFEAGCGR